jgi:hypothetical protein
LPPHHNEEAVAVVLAAVVLAITLAAADRTEIPVANRTDTLDRVVTSADRMVISEVSTIHSGDRSTGIGMGIRTDMDIRLDTRAGRSIIRTSLGT